MIGRKKNNKNRFPLNLLIVQREQQKELRNINYKLSTYISDRRYGCFMQELEDIEIICYDSEIYLPQSMLRLVMVLDWYHFYLYHPGGSRLAKTTREVYFAIIANYFDIVKFLHGVTVSSISNVCTEVGIYVPRLILLFSLYN